MSEYLRRKMECYRQYIFWILATGYVVVYFHRLCPAVVALDMMRDLRSGGTLIGVLGSAYFYPYALMQLPAGLLSDSWGPRRSITFFFGIAFVGSLFLGFATNIAVAVTGRILVGLGVSMLFVPTMKILAEWFEARRFATMTGILMAMGGLGSLIAASPLAALSSWIGWRGSFLAVGGVTLLLGLAVWFVVRDTPSDMGFPRPDDALGERAKPVGLLQGMRIVASTLAFWPLAGWFFSIMAIFFSFAGLWGGPYLMQIYGLSKAQAGAILSMCALGMIIGSPALSHLSNKVFRARKPVMVLSSLCTLAIVGTFYIAIGKPADLVHVCALPGDGDLYECYSDDWVYYGQGVVPGEHGGNVRRHGKSFPFCRRRGFPACNRNDPRGERQKRKRIYAAGLPPGLFDPHRVRGNRFRMLAGLKGDAEEVILSPVKLLLTILMQTAGEHYGRDNK